jgi:thiol:disulfide interchange protein
METFKKAMGMLLLLTVVWLLSSLEWPLLVPTFALLVGITAACWWVAKTPLTDPLTARLRAWGEALAIVGVAAIACYGLLYPNVMLPRYQAQLDAYADKRLATSQMQIAQQLGGVKDNAELQRVVADLVASSAVDGDKPWQDFTLAKLGRLAIDERRTVLVDFTADWCASCKFFEQTVLKTDDVTQALDGGGVATMSADYTKKPGWMRETIRALGGIGVPVLAIFPADRPYEPIVFTGGYTKSGLLEAIAQATGRAGTKTAARAGVAAASER